MNCPRCGGRLIIAIYAICSRCRYAAQPHELVGIATEAAKDTAAQSASAHKDGPAQ